MGQHKACVTTCLTEEDLGLWCEEICEQWDSAQPASFHLKLGRLDDVLMAEALKELVMMLGETFESLTLTFQFEQINAQSLAAFFRFVCASPSRIVKHVMFPKGMVLACGHDGMTEVWLAEFVQGLHDRRFQDNTVLDLSQGDVSFVQLEHLFHTIESTVTPDNMKIKLTSHMISKQEFFALKSMLHVRDDQHGLCIQLNHKTLVGPKSRDISFFNALPTVLECDESTSMNYPPG